MGAMCSLGLGSLAHLYPLMFLSCMKSVPARNIYTRRGIAATKSGKNVEFFVGVAYIKHGAKDVAL